MKLSKDDLRILRAALAAALEGDEDPWDELSGDDLDRAAELLDDLAAEIDDEDDDDLWEDEDEEDGDPKPLGGLDED